VDKTDAAPSDEVKEVFFTKPDDPKSKRSRDKPYQIRLATIKESGLVIGIFHRTLPTQKENSDLKDIVHKMLLQISKEFSQQFKSKYSTMTHTFKEVSDEKSDMTDQDIRKGFENFQVDWASLFSPLSTLNIQPLKAKSRSVHKAVG